MRRNKMIFVLIVACMFTFCGCGSDKNQTGLEPISLEAEQQEEEAEQEEPAEHIVVYVCGAIQREGVYELPIGSRVYEAIQMAGGFTKKAATSAMNQAEILEDEAFVYVPTKKEVSSGTGVTTSGQDAGKVNLNKATKEELMTLSGVGEAKANQIIRYREEHGKFHKIEDIMQISGIKEGLFEKIKDNITV